MLVFMSGTAVAQFVSTKFGLRPASIGFVHDKFVEQGFGRTNPVLSMFPFGTECRLRFLEGRGRKLTAGSVGDIYVRRSKNEPSLMGSQATIQIIEVESELLFEAHMPNFPGIDGQKQSIEYDAPLGCRAIDGHYRRAARQMMFH